MFEQTIRIASRLIEENLYDKVRRLSSIGANHFVKVKLNFQTYLWAKRYVGYQNFLTQTDFTGL